MDPVGALVDFGYPVVGVKPQLVGDQGDIVEIVEAAQVARSVFGAGWPLVPCKARIPAAQAGETEESALGQTGAGPPGAIDPQLREMPVPRCRLRQFKGPHLAPFAVLLPPAGEAAATAENGPGACRGRPHLALVGGRQDQRRVQLVKTVGHFDPRRRSRSAEPPAGRRGDSPAVRPSRPHLEPRTFPTSGRRRRGTRVGLRHTHRQHIDSYRILPYFLTHVVLANAKFRRVTR